MSKYADQQQVTNPKTGKVERVFVNLEAVYPTINDLVEEMSFEELRAKSRGWLNRDWAAENSKRTDEGRQRSSTENHRLHETMSKGQSIDAESELHSQQDSQTGTDTQDSLGTRLENTLNVETSREGRTGRPRKTKLREVKGETQTSTSPNRMFSTRKLIRDSQN